MRVEIINANISIDDKPQASLKPGGNSRVGIEIEDVTLRLSRGSMEKEHVEKLRNHLNNLLQNWGQ